MTDRILVIGGQGRIGSQVVQDLWGHVDAEIVATGRHKTKQPENPRSQFLALDLDDREGLHYAIKNSNLVIHCAGPFHHRDGRVLKACIEQGVNYLDVSDHRSFYNKVIAYHEEAAAAGVTAILNTGVFPGISNSMVRQGIEQLDEAEKIHLSYLVAGSGGAGLTVMRTTFLGLQNSFDAWIDGQWQKILPYSDRETVEFPPPFGKAGVYWFDIAETHTLAESFPVQSVITKFGSIPDFYNHLTWMTARLFPHSWLQDPKKIEFLSRVSLQMTSFTDRFSGIGIAIRAEILGKKDGQRTRHCSTMVHENTAAATGFGTGSVAELILAGKLHKPGVWAIEKALPTELFIQAMDSRGIKIHQQKLPT